jgi:PPOX class probable F420-dependent enzyme
MGMNHDLDLVRSMVTRDHGLCSVSVVRQDRTPHTSLVNAGVLEHPFTGEPVVGFVTNGRVKLRTLRVNPAVAALWRSGWSWVCVEGRCDVIGPDDPTDGVDAEHLRLLLRNIFVAAGGTHDDWDTYDATMRAERRAAVLVHPTRIYGVG